MGRMKEVFMKMREENWEGTPEEYLQHYVERQGILDSLCPSHVDNIEEEEEEQIEDIDDFCPDLDEYGDIDYGRNPNGDYWESDGSIM
jgi:hypothetical protein